MHSVAEQSVRRREGQCRSGSRQRWIWVFRFSPPWEKFSASRTFLCFLTRRRVAETVSQRRGRGEGERLGEEVMVGMGGEM